MSVAQPLLEAPHHPSFGAVVARQLSVWPFAARMQRLFLLVDPSAPNPWLRDGLVRAMQQAYFRSDGQSQTRSVREALLAAHYVLKHQNRDALPLAQVCAATAVAAVRGRSAFVALSGDASAFAWRDGRLTGLHGVVRLGRPLGLEADPGIALWSTPLAPGGRLVLVCGSDGRADAPDVLRGILERELPAEETEQLAREALASTRQPGVLVVEPARRHLRLLPPPRPESPRPEPAAPRGQTAWPRALASLAGLLLLAALALAAVVTTRFVPSAQPVPTSVPAGRVNSVDPQLAVRLGPAGGNVIDLAVGEDALYTLDVVENSVRAFGLDGRDQQPLPETVLLRPGAPISGSTRRLAAPVAIAYVTGGLLVVDRDRTVAQLGRDRALTLRTPPSSATWGELGALGSDLTTHLFVVDSRAHRLLDYQLTNQRPVEPPRTIVPSSSGVPLERAVEAIGVQGAVYLRFEDGSMRWFDALGLEHPFAPATPDGKAAVVSGVAPDRHGGLYTADAANARVIHTTREGAYVRELRHPALAGVRQITSSLDGRRMYGLVASGVLMFDVPDADSGHRD